MKKLILLLSVIFLYSCGAQKATIEETRTSKSIIIYDTMNDYLNKTPLNIKAKVIIKDESDQHVTLKIIFDPETGKKIKKWENFWVINYNGENYFNLFYSKDMPLFKTFVKLDIEGEICGFILDKDSHKIFNLKNSVKAGPVIGNGKIGIAIVKTTKSGGVWIDENNIYY